MHFKKQAIGGLDSVHVCSSINQLKSTRFFTVGGFVYLIE